MREKGGRLRQGFPMKRIAGCTAYYGYMGLELITM